MKNCGESDGYSRDLMINRIDCTALSIKRDGKYNMSSFVDLFAFFIINYREFM